MSERYFLEHPPGEVAAKLVGSEAQHLAKVMRAAIGDQVTLFDGRGSEFLAEVRTIGRGEVELAIVERRTVPHDSSRDVTLAVALPKGDRQKWLIEKATELGVTRLVPLVTRRGVAQPTEKALDRLRRTVIEASKQCGRNYLLEITPAAELSTYVGRAPADLRLVAHPGEAKPAADLLAENHGPVACLIGPEGGFADDEIDLARAAGWRCVTLGPQILRVETAALAFAVLSGIGGRD